jgi:hypothetical protein
VRPSVPLALAVVLALAASGAAGPAVPGAVAPTAVAPVKRRSADRREAINKIEKDWNALFADAKLDAAAALIRTYRGYTTDQLAAPASRDVHVQELLKVVEDESVKLEFREMAANAIIWDVAQKHDPELDTGANKGLRRPRAAFSRKVLPLLTDKSEGVRGEFTRGLAKLILEGLWPGVRDPDITTCRPANLPSCRVARTAWEKVLQR